MMDVVKERTPQPPPVLAIKRGTGVNGHWQDVVGINDHFSTFSSKTLGGYRPKRSGSTGPRSRHGITRYSPPRLATATSSSTLPRNLNKTSPVRDMTQELESLRLPPGIEELERMYAHMKNLSQPLPNAPSTNGTSALPGLLPWTDVKRDDDQESEICSVIADIPPPPAPVQSHALLEESLGHQLPPLPRTPASTKLSPAEWGKTPPLPPRRTSSKLSLLSPKPSTSSSQDSGIYANAVVHRTSLMSTGSSGESSSSNSVEQGANPSTTPASTADDTFFSWPGWSSAASPSPSGSEEPNLRSVSQLGDPPGSSAASDVSRASHVYAKMSRDAKSAESDYISVLYSAVQRQSGKGVETAVSPYLRLMKSENEKCQKRLSDLSRSNVKEAPAASIDSLSSAVYARPSTRGRKSAEFAELLREVERKRSYRVGLNLFNAKPELGIEYLVQKEFLALSPPAVARFLHERNSGLAKEKVGEYLGQLQSPFAMKVLSCFVEDFNFSATRLDKALRMLLSRVRVPGEAQKIERIMEVFGKRYAKCNPGFAAKLRSPESVVTLSFAVMLLNTDLHTPNLKDEKKMSVSDFVDNLRGVDGGADFDPKLLRAIYKSIKKRAFAGGDDHVLQTQKIQQNLVQASHKRPPLNLAEPHRRLVCLCKLHEVLDINATKKPSSSDHQRDVFLFNDLVVVSKQTASTGKGSKGPAYAYRDSFHLQGLEVTLFHTPVFDYGIQISRKASGCVLLTLNAGSEHDRYKFVMDLQESIFEMNQMEEALADVSAS